MSSKQKKGRGKPKGEKPRKEKVVEEVEEEVKKVEKAVVKEARKVEREVERKAPRHQQPRPSGRVPVATVRSRHGTTMITRPGRGFSLGELSGGGVPPGLAAKWGARIDSRRRSVLEGNVSALKAWHATSARAEVEHEAKVVEEKLEEAAKEVEKGAEAVEKEAVKAGKAVKKEVKKAEKAVKGKVEKKPRPKKKAKS